jgi:heme a synthase
MQSLTPHEPLTSPPSNAVLPSGFCDILGIGYGTAVAMWAVGYVGHMPLTHIPPVVFVSLMLVCQVVGGCFAGRYTRRGISGAIWIGVVSSAINLLILGSLLRQPHSGQLVPQAWLWLPGTFAVGILLALVGAIFEQIGRPFTRTKDINWPAVLAWITCAAGMLLIAAGGLVTGFRAGMAVPDWPNTYGSNMFLFPLTLMTGGVFYEHAHRLLGTLVGLSTLTLAIYLTAATQGRKKLLMLIWIVGLCVAIQGVLGGFRVTDDSHCLAVVHGFFAHAILGGLVAVAVMLSRGWHIGSDFPRCQGSDVDQFLTCLLVGLILVQTLLGTLVRQLDVYLLTHISVAVIVALVAVGTGARAWGLHADIAMFRRCGIAVMYLVLLQALLGIVSVIFRTPRIDQSPSAETLLADPNSLPVQPLPALVTTLHQSTAAILLVVAVVLALWSWRLLSGSRSLSDSALPLSLQ